MTTPRTEASNTIALRTIITEFRHEEWGFTGTRAGMRPFQFGMVRRVLSEGQPLVFLHGGAVGSDFEAHGIWRELCPDTLANVWPADEKRALQFLKSPRVKIEPVMPPLDRNVEIVKRSDMMIATPHSEKEEIRAGTWHTIRQALRIGCPTLIIWPFSSRMTWCRDRMLYRVLFTAARDDT